VTNRIKINLEIVGLFVAIFACIATYWGIIPEDRRWPFTTDDSGEMPTSTPPISNPTTPTPNPWAGIIDLDNRGLDLIQGYELWFSSLAGNRWQIWHLDSQTGEINRIPLDVPAEQALIDQFVPSVSPNGEKMALSIGPCEEGGHCDRDLYLANVDGSNVVQLTNDNCLDEFHASWSPNGQFLTYFAGIWNDPVCSNSPHGIWVMNVGTGEVQKLTDRGDFDPVWSPNGRYIAYHSAEPSWDLKVLDFDSCGTEINSCTTWIAANIGTLSSSAAWINDNMLAFTSDETGNFELYTVPVILGQTLKPTRITNNNWDDQYPAVSTDGKIIIWQAFPYYDQGDSGAATGKTAIIYVMAVDELEPKPLITGIGNARDGFLKPLP